MLVSMIYCPDWSAVRRPGTTTEILPSARLEPNSPGAVGSYKEWFLKFTPLGVFLVCLPGNPYSGRKSDCVINVVKATTTKKPFSLQMSHAWEPSLQQVINMLKGCVLSDPETGVRPTGLGSGISWLLHTRWLLDVDSPGSWMLTARGRCTKQSTTAGVTSALQNDVSHASRGDFPNLNVPTHWSNKLWTCTAIMNLLHRFTRESKGLWRIRTQTNSLIWPTNHSEKAQCCLQKQHQAWFTVILTWLTSPDVQYRWPLLESPLCLL